MYAQLGEIVFEGLQGFSSLQLKSEQLIAEHQPIEGKTRLQNVGSKADELSIGLSIKSAFANPEEQYRSLKEYQQQAAILPLINGQGELLGDFVIKTIELDIVKTDPKGRWVEIELSVVLIENFDADKKKKAELDAKNSGFANIEKMPVLTSTIPLGTDAATVMEKVTQVGADANTATSLLDKAKLFAGQANSYMDQAAGKIQDIKSNLSGIQDKITGSLTLPSSATNLLNQISGLQAGCNNMLSALQLHDLQTALGLNSVLQGQFGTMMINAAPITNLIATQS